MSTIPKQDYLQCLFDIEKLCSDFKRQNIEAYFTNGKAKNKYFCFFPAYRREFEIIRRIIEVCDIFGIEKLEKEKEYLLKCVHFLENPEAVENEKDFETYIGIITNRFSDVKDEIKKKISLLNPEEMDRLNEAIHCFLEGCNYSAIAMSVSAIEFRLLSLMISVNPDPRLEEMTLGQLISEYLENKGKYKEIIPKKHEPLLNLCNTYRIFSVHPKKEKMSKGLAGSVLNLTFNFLLDEKLIKKIIS